MNEIPDDIEEAEIPDLPDEVLERVVAEWLEDVEVLDPDTGEWVPQTADEIRDGKGDAPDYTSDAAAAWRLMERMPGQVLIDRTAETVALQPWANTVEFFEGDIKRALTEAAAILALRGVEPREVPDD